MEAEARGMEDVAAKMTEQINQQRNFMQTWEEQQRINIIMMKGETMGSCPRMVISQTLETWVEEVRLWSRQSP